MTRNIHYYIFILDKLQIKDLLIKHIGLLMEHVERYE